MRAATRPTRRSKTASARASAHASTKCARPSPSTAKTIAAASTRSKPRKSFPISLTTEKCAPVVCEQRDAEVYAAAEGETDVVARARHVAPQAVERVCAERDEDERAGDETGRVGRGAQCGQYVQRTVN